ncbi:type IX secretion system plug protein [Polaribacter sp. M15]
MTKTFLTYLFLIFGSIVNAQNIKSIQLRPLEENNFSAIVPLGTVLELSFDDLDADSKDYMYRIEHMTHDWKKSRLLSSQFIDGFDENTIIDVTNSFNTFQSYTHYSVRIPNVNTIITKSGNYLLSVLNDADEVQFTRKFVLYENATTIGVQVSRSRNAKTVNTQQTVEFTINHPNLRINNPSQEVNVVLLKNENWNDKITDLQPTFFKSNQLKYTYTNKTNFWGGNEYLNFDTKSVRNKSLNVVKIEMKDIFHHYLYPYTYNPFLTYRFNPDINGQFVIRTLEGNDPDTEADYAMMHFTLYADEPFSDKKVHVYGAFNNFFIDEETEMQYNFKNSSYTAAILLKQGFYNYTFATIDNYGNVNTNDVNGTFFQTENQYTVITYFKPFGGLYDRVVGVGTTFFDQNR